MPIIKKIPNQKKLKLILKTDLDPAIALLNDSSLLFQIALRLEKQGYISETPNKLATYLAGTTKDYYRNERICVIAKGPSGAGKSYYTVSIYERYFPDSVKAYTRMTARAPDYWAKEIGTLDGKILIIKQLEGAQDAHYAIQIMTDTTSGGLKILTVTGKAGDMKTEEKSLEGFPVMCTTVVEVDIDPQTMRRFYTTFPDDSPQQTQRILMHKAKMTQDPTYKRMVETTDEVLIAIPKRLKEESAKYDVVIPFAEIIAAGIFPSNSLLSRSDFDKFLNFIKASTHLHYKQRLSYTTELGKIALIASPIDYYYAWKIIEPSMPKRLSGIDDSRAIRVLEVVQNNCDRENGATTDDIFRTINETGRPYARNSISVSLSMLREKGFIKSEKNPRDGRELIWKTANKHCNLFGVTMPNQLIENCYIQFIIDKIGKELSTENMELEKKSMRAFDLDNGTEITQQIVSERIRDMLHI